MNNARKKKITDFFKKREKKRKRVSENSQVVAENNQLEPKKKKRKTAPEGLTNMTNVENIDSASQLLQVQPVHNEVIRERQHQTIEHVIPTSTEQNNPNENNVLPPPPPSLEEREEQTHHEAEERSEEHEDLDNVEDIIPPPPPLPILTRAVNYRSLREELSKFSGRKIGVVCRRFNSSGVFGKSEPKIVGGMKLAEVIHESISCKCKSCLGEETNISHSGLKSYHRGEKCRGKLSILSETRFHRSISLCNLHETTALILDDSSNVGAILTKFPSSKRKLVLQQHVLPMNRRIRELFSMIYKPEEDVGMVVISIKRIRIGSENERVLMLSSKVGEEFVRSFYSLKKPYSEDIVRVLGSVFVRSHTIPPPEEDMEDTEEEDTEDSEEEDEEEDGDDILKKSIVKFEIGMDKSVDSSRSVAVIKFFRENFKNKVHVGSTDRDYGQKECWKELRKFLENKSHDLIGFNFLLSLFSFKSFCKAVLSLPPLFCFYYTFWNRRLQF